MTHDKPAGPTTTVYLLRHARAGRRSAWPGDDRLRPLSGAGRRQARALADSIGVAASHDGAFAGGVVRVFTSPWVRCAQTVEPLAAAAGVEIAEIEQVGEGMGAKAVAFIDEVASGLHGNGPAVVCTHGDIVEEELAELRRRGVRLGKRVQFPKGSAWILIVANGRIDRGRYLGPPHGD